MMSLCHISHSVLDSTTLCYERAFGGSLHSLRLSCDFHGFYGLNCKQKVDKDSINILHGD